MDLAIQPTYLELLSISSSTIISHLCCLQCSHPQVVPLFSHQLYWLYLFFPYIPRILLCFPWPPYFLPIRSVHFSNFPCFSPVFPTFSCSFSRVPHSFRGFSNRFVPLCFLGKTHSFVQAFPLTSAWQDLAELQQKLEKERRQLEVRKWRELGHAGLSRDAQSILAPIYQ